jgi:acetyltransferase-like isoleucine patch superfamily enzyme
VSVAPDSNGVDTAASVAATPPVRRSLLTLLLRALRRQLRRGRRVLPRLRYLLRRWQFDSAGRRGAIEAGVRILGDARIHLGERVTLRRGVVLAGNGRLHIGSGTTINDGCQISAFDEIHIGANCMFAPRVCVLDIDHRFDTRTQSLREQGYRTAPVHIGDDVWLGVNVVVLRGVRIGRGAIVAANSVVTRDVADFAIVAGAPARLLRMRPA